MSAERPTKEEVVKAMLTLNDIMLFVAMRGMWNSPDPNVMKLTAWLKEEFGYTSKDLEHPTIKTDQP